MLKVIETFRGAKGRHPTSLCVCDCGRERVVRTTRLKLGLVTQCAACSRAEAAARGAETKRLPFSIGAPRESMGVYLANARRRGIGFELTEADVARLIFAPCTYCVAHPTPAGGIDRSDNSEGYTAANSVPCCAICNYAKRGMSASAFLEWAERIHAHQSLLQRDRPVLLRLAEQPHGRRAHHAGGYQ